MSSLRRHGPTHYGLAAVGAVALAGLIGSCNAILGFEQGEASLPSGGGSAAGGGGQGGEAGVGGLGGLGGVGGVGGELPISWSLRFGDGDQEHAIDVVEDGAGNVIVAGGYEGSLDVHGHILEGSGGGSNVFLAKLDTHGQLDWVHGFLGHSEDQGRAVAINEQGQVILAGFFVGEIDLGDGPLTATGTARDVFVARYDGDGAHQWSTAFPATNNEEAFDVAWDASSDEIALAGRFAGALHIGDSLTSAGDYDVFVAKLSQDGTALWAKQFGDAAHQGAVALAVAGDGSIFVTGELYGTADFGFGDVPYAAGTDIFLARLDANGDGLWGHGFGTLANEEPRAIAVDAQRNVIICGYLSGMVDFGGGPLAPPNGADMFIAKFDPNGGYMWSNSFGGGTTDVCHSLAVDTDGSVLAAGRSDGTPDFGGGPLDCLGAGAIFLVRFDAEGNHLDSTCFGQSGTHIPMGLAVTSTHGVLLAGALNGTADFGHELLVSGGGTDVFVAKLAL